MPNGMGIGPRRQAARQAGSHLERTFDVRELVACQGEIALGLVQHQIQEQAHVVGHQPDQVVLIAQRDQNVFNAFAQASAMRSWFT